MLQRLEEQTCKSFEVVVADDGSADGTAEAIQALANQVTFPLRIVTQPHCGYRLARSRNSGAKAAASKQLVFLDDDCLPTSKFLASYRAAFRERCILRGDILFVSAFDKLEPVLYRHPATRDLWGASFSIPRALFLEIGGFDEDFINQAGEDTDLGQRLIRMGVKNICVPGAYVYHLGLPHRGGMPSSLYLQVKKNDHTIQRNVQRQEVE